MLSGPPPNMNPETPTSSAASARSTIVAMTRKNFTTPEAASGGLAYRHAFLFQRLLQFAGLKHFAHNVATADKLAFHIELRDRRPVGIGLDAIPDLVGLQHVDAFVADSKMIEDLDHLAGKSTHRKLRRALHEQHHVVSLHFIVDELLDSHGILSCWAARAPVTSIYVAKKLPPTQEHRPNLLAFRGIKCALDLENIVLVKSAN